MGILQLACRMLEMVILVMLVVLRIALMMFLVVHAVRLHGLHVTGHRRHCHGLKRQGQQEQGSKGSANGQAHLSVGLAASRADGGTLDRHSFGTVHQIKFQRKQFLRVEIIPLSTNSCHATAQSTLQ